MTTVFCGRISDELAAQIDALIAQDKRLKNRSVVVALALESWATAQEGGRSLEDRIAARLEHVIRRELAHVQALGAGHQKPPDPHADKRKAFLRAGRH